MEKLFPLPKMRFSFRLLFILSNNLIVKMTKRN